MSVSICAPLMASWASAVLTGAKGVAVAVGLMLFVAVVVRRLRRVLRLDGTVPSSGNKVLEHASTIGCGVVRLAASGGIRTTKPAIIADMTGNQLREGDDKAS